VIKNSPPHTASAATEQYTDAVDFIEKEQNRSITFSKMPDLSRRTMLKSAPSAAIGRVAATTVPHGVAHAADDMQLRTSFTLLDAIFASVVGSVPGAKLLLTLPVK
jgi:hypothetical protein